MKLFSKINDKNKIIYYDKMKSTAITFSVTSGLFYTLLTSIIVQYKEFLLLPALFLFFPVMTLFGFVGSLVGYFMAESDADVIDDLNRKP